MSNLQPLLEAFKSQYRAPKYIPMPLPPRTGSHVPWLTSLYHEAQAGDFGSRSYPGNCSGNLIRDLLFYFQPKSVFDPMTGSGTCKDVCDSLGIPCVSSDLRDGIDASDPRSLPDDVTFDMVWLHPPYYRMIAYNSGPGDLSAAPTLEAFRDQLRKVIANAMTVLKPGGKIAILMGDYTDRELGFMPLAYETKRICFELGLIQPCTDIIRFSHGASSSGRRYRSSFIPGLHDVCMIFEASKAAERDAGTANGVNESTVANTIAA